MNANIGDWITYRDDETNILRTALVLEVMKRGWLEIYDPCTPDDTPWISPELLVERIRVSEATEFSRIRDLADKLQNPTY